MPRGAGPAGAGPGTTVGHEAQERDASHRGGMRRVGMVVDEDGERDVLVGGKRGGVAAVAGPDGDDLRASALGLVVSVAQLRGVLPAEQAAEVPQKDED